MYFLTHTTEGRYGVNKLRRESSLTDFCPECLQKFLYLVMGGAVVYCITTSAIDVPLAKVTCLLSKDANRLRPSETLLTDLETPVDTYPEWHYSSMCVCCMVAEYWQGNFNIFREKPVSCGPCLATRYWTMVVSQIRYRPRRFFFACLLEFPLLLGILSGCVQSSMTSGLERGFSPPQGT